jgi:hypothetical protein
LAFFNIIYDEVFALWMVTPAETGGMGYSSNDIGFCLAIMGVVGIVSQLFLYPVLQARFNTVQLYRVSMCTYPAIFALFPVITALRGVQGVWWFLLSAVMLRVLANVFAFTSIMMLINNSTSMSRLGL